MIDFFLKIQVTSINQIWEWAHGLLNNDGALFVLKGTDYKTESDYKEQNEIKIDEIKPELK